MKESSKAATLKQIAEEAGVSVKTVSNILNNRTKAEWPSIKARAERVKAIAERLNYRPNASARMMRGGRYNLIGLLTRIKSTVQPFELIKGIEAALEGQSIRLINQTLDIGESFTSESLRCVLDQIIMDGCLLNASTRFPEEIASEFARFRLPIVWLNDKLMRNAVYPDDAEVSRRMAERMLELGWKQFEFVTLTGCDGEKERPEDRHHSMRDRIEAIREVVNEAGHPLKVRLLGRPPKLRQAHEPARSYLRELQGGTCVFTYNEYDAAVLATHNRSWAAQADSKSVALNTFTRDPEFSQVYPSFCAEVPWLELGREATNLLIERVEKEGADLESRAISFGPIREPECMPR